MVWMKSAQQALYQHSSILSSDQLVPDLALVDAEYLKVPYESIQLERKLDTGKIYLAAMANKVLRIYQIRGRRQRLFNDIQRQMERRGGGN